MKPHLGSPVVVVFRWGRARGAGRSFLFTTAGTFALAIETEGTPKGSIATRISPLLNIFANPTLAIFVDFWFLNREIQSILSSVPCFEELAILVIVASSSWQAHDYSIQQNDGEDRKDFGIHDWEVSV